MKTDRSFISCLIPSAGARAALLLVSALFALSATARAQIFVTNRNINTIGEYTLDGATVNAALINTGLNNLSQSSNPYGIAVSGSYMYVANSNADTVVRYNLDGSNATPLIDTGRYDPVNNNTGLYNPSGIAVSGGFLYVTSAADSNGGWIGKYDLNGTAVNARLINTGLLGPVGIAVSGTDLFVTNTNFNSLNNGYVGKYTTSGGVANATLIAGMYSPTSIAVSGSNLFVDNISGTSNVIGEYTLLGAFTKNISGVDSIAGMAVLGDNLYFTQPGGGRIGVYSISGDLVNAFLVPSGLDSPYGLAVSAVPEPSTYAAIAGAAMLGFAFWHRRRRSTSAATLGVDAAA